MFKLRGVISVCGVLMFSTASSGLVNIEFRPENPVVQVGAEVRIGVYLVSSDSENGQLFATADIMFGWSPSVLRLLGLDNTGAAPLFFSGFPNDGGNVNEVIPPQDGTGYYAAWAPFGHPVEATPAGTLVTTFRFLALASACPGSVVNVLEQAGSPPRRTVIYSGVIPNLNITGSLGSTSIIVDSTPPTVTAGSIASCYPSAAAAEAAARAATSATDNCTPTDQLVFQTSTTGTCAAVVTVTVRDAAGNQAAVSYNTRIDASPPTLVPGTCPGDQSVNAEPGQCDAHLSFAPPSFNDNCTQSPAAQCVRSDGLLLSLPYPNGSTTVTCTATDECGLVSAPCQFTVTVNDTQDPVLHDCPGNVTRDADPGACSATVSWAPPTATDNCPGVSLSSNHNPGDSFPVGMTTVTYTARDAGGRTASCSFTVTVNDTQDPVIHNCPGDIHVHPNLTMCHAVVSWAPATASDNCPGVMLSSDHNPGDVFPQGATTVSYTATDAAHRTTTCHFDVIVEPFPDMNDDGLLTIAGDLQPFINVLLGLDTDPLHLVRADLNCDGLDDGDDIQLFVDALIH